MNTVEIYLKKRNKVLVEQNQHSIEWLEAKKQEAVLDQEFEKAALIRQQIDLLKDKINKSVIATFQKNLESLGYIFHPSVIEALCGNVSKKQVFHFFDEVIVYLKEALGEKEYKPFYPNFPQQVMEASEAELYLNASLHYFSSAVADFVGNPNVIWVPAYHKKN